jgi:mediator of RNA polymerase II transcription subunit 12
LGEALSILDDPSILPNMETLLSLLRSPAVRHFILKCAIYHKQSVQEHIMDVLSSQKDAQVGSILLRSTIEGLLDQQGQISGDVPNQEKIPRLVRMVGELSLPLCQLEMQLLLNSGTKASEGSVEMASSLFEAIMRSPESERPPWLDLMDGLDAALLQRLRAIAELKVLKIVNECFARIKGDAAEADRPQINRVKSALRRLLYVVDCTIVTQVSPAGVSQVVPAESELPSTDRFGVIREVLVKHFVFDVESKAVSLMTSELICCLLTGLLHLLVVRKLSSEGQRIAPADAASLLPIFFSILTQSILGASRSTTELLYDMASCLSDDLSDEYRGMLIRTEMPKYPNDPRISFILGPPSSTDAWLGLVTTNQLAPPSTPAPATPVPQTPAARFGNQQQGNPRFQQPVRPPTPQRPSSTSTQQKSFNPPVPFPLRRWELLPDQGSSTTANDTAISLSLVGARKV